MGAVFQAITRRVAPSLSSCELTFVGRTTLDHEIACRQQTAYVEALRGLGVDVVDLEAMPEFPDSCFVEDTAVVLDECAIVLPMGSNARDGEQLSIGNELKRFREVRWLSVGKMEGGDVLGIGRTLYIGESTRTDRSGILALRKIVEQFGYSVVSVRVHGCLHLKTACTAVWDDTLVANPDWIEMEAFDGMDIIHVADGEKWAGNVLRVGDTVLMPLSSQRTARIVESRGACVRLVDVSELQKAEAGLTCMSILFRMS